MWTFEHSVDCRVSRDFAWRFWTDVNNWPVVDSSVEAVTLNGPFQCGATGTTKPRDAAPVQWQLEEVREGSSAVVLIPVPGAALRFAWKFDNSGINATRITQRASLEGETARDYIAAIAPDLERNMPQGMRKLAEAMEKTVSGRS